MNSILRHVAALLNYENDTELEELYMKTAWMFDRKYGKPGASYDAFKHAVTLVFFYLSNIIVAQAEQLYCICGQFQPLREVTSAHLQRPTGVTCKQLT